MGDPLEISADEIAGWSATKPAEHVLPKLVRRLVAASVQRGLVQFRADAGVRLPGFDGIVNASEPGFFCPQGLSLWELSVRQDVRSKASKDFEDRVQTPVAGVVYRDATYVAVTGRRFPSRDKWQAQKRARSVFAQVIAYDADDLAHALEQAPAVAVWFADQLGRPLIDLMDVESFLGRWSRETRPALPITLLTSGRLEPTQAVTAWLENDDASPLRVQADTREEAAAFIAAVLAADDRVARLSRAVVVESPEAWRTITRRVDREPLLLVPVFEPLPAADVGENIRVAIPVGGGARVAGGISLPPLKPDAVSDALVSAGFPRRRAEDVARSSRGKLAAVKRLCDLPRTPSWASGDPILLAMLLLGAWQPAREADCRAIENLGISAADADARSASLSRAEDPPIERRGAAWRWTSPKDAWRALASHLGELLLKRFQTLAIHVLGQPLEAGTFGATVPHSSALRAGIAESLVRLGLSDDELKSTFGTTSHRARA